ncbi:LOW QUALITY PROTEIN: inactive serine protease 54 [Liasis olivaceus]
MQDTNYSKNNGKLKLCYACSTDVCSGHPTDNARKNGEEIWKLRQVQGGLDDGFARFFHIAAGCGRQARLAPTNSAQEAATVGGLPWMVSLQDQDSHIAFGSILSKYWILSAASSFHSSCPLSAGRKLKGARPTPGMEEAVEVHLMKFCSSGPGDLPEKSGRSIRTIRKVQDSRVPLLGSQCFLRFLAVSCYPSFVSRTQISALAGASDLEGHRESLVPIQTIIPHKAFDEITLVHNIALLKASTPFRFSKTTQPVCFPTPDFPVATLGKCLVAGWLDPGEVSRLSTCKAPSLSCSFQHQRGSLEARNSLPTFNSALPTFKTSQRLFAVLAHPGNGLPQKLSVEDVDRCPLRRTTSTECCSHRESGSVPGCLGSAGSPVLCEVEGTQVLKGVLSEGGARCYGPFLYSRVIHYSDWIVTTTAKWGAPASPFPGQRYSAFGAPAEEHEGLLFEPFLELRASDASDALESPLSLNLSKKLNESSPGLPKGPAESRANPPLYYDYYGGELLPASSAESGQPWGMRALIGVGFLLRLRAC